MPTAEQIQMLGAEIERIRRTKPGEFPTVKSLATAAGISYTRLTEILKGYKRPGRTATMPSDYVLDRLAEVLDVPVSRFHTLLGRHADPTYPVLQHPDTLDIAETYDRLPDYGKKMLRDMLGIVLETVTFVEERTAAD